eukprot:3651257-Rhodomonas_salina.3
MQAIAFSVQFVPGTRLIRLLGTEAEGTVPGDSRVLIPSDPEADGTEFKGGLHSLQATVDVYGYYGTLRILQLESGTDGGYAATLESGTDGGATKSLVLSDDATTLELPTVWD